MVDTSMMDLYRSEVEQQAAVLNDAFLVLENDPAAGVQLEAAMRAAHSIKGAAKLLDIPIVVKLAHVMEDCLVAAQQGRLILSSDAIDILLKGMDVIGQISVFDAGPEEWLKLNQDHYASVLTNLETIQSLKSEVAAEVESNQHSALAKDVPAHSSPVSQAAPEMNVADMSMFELFRVESDQQGRVLNEGLLDLEQDARSPERLEPLMRAAHSIKGAARLVGLQAVVSLAHVMEDVFVAAQKGSLVLGGNQIDVLLRGVDTITEIARFEGEVNGWLAANQLRYDELIANLRAVFEGKSPVTSEQTVSAASAVVTSPQPELETVVAPAPTQQAAAKKQDKSTAQPKERVLRVSADQLNRLMGLAGESLVESRWLYPYASSLQRLKRQQTDLIGVLDSLREHLDRERGSDTLVTLARSAQKQASFCRETMADRLAELESYDRRSTNLSSRLHREVVKSRMRPFGDGVHGFPRMVRDISRSLGKDVQLVIQGETTLVDRDILDKIEAPLNHLLRNAIDHGIDSAEDRAAAGKPAKGTITLSAYHNAGMLSIVVADDGRGVDLERLRRKVLEKKLVDESMAETLGETELLEFLFLPSFSTKDSVSEISGRGVGLDVVHDVVQEMRGTVRALTEFGKGTRFQMQLPLTLSVIPALLVEISGEPYAFPLARIDKILRIENEIIQEAEGNQFFTVDGKSVGLVSASQIIGMADSVELEGQLSVVVLHERNGYYGLVVEKFLGERELVVQVMPEQLGKVQDISSAALMEDGSPVLIVDVDDLLRSVEKVLRTKRLSKVNAVQVEDLPRKRVLVVDDSITVREVERKLLESAGYAVDVAVDGMDGLNALRMGQYNMLVTDVDMPRMNGIELVKTVRQDPTLRSIPIMMVSYKDRDEDRMRGLEAGADYYLTKGSFHDQGLLQAAVDLIGKADEV
ncbi:MAG: hybrid sensor histidine kinase/response regulator [Gammaproteobacteria bacterium]|nr:hybrid sensor histidine kinase/response regulator [Gammaproteobacteria bacterium]